MARISTSVSSCDTNRANSEAAMTGAATPRRTASSTVQRPSPESAAVGAMPSKPGFSSSPFTSRSSSHDRTTEPVCHDLQPGQHVDAQLAGLEDGVALGEGLHHPVLDAVVDHLGEVPGAGRADVGQPLARARRQRLEGGPQHLDVLVEPADHEGVAVLEAPHAAAGAGVDPADARLRPARRRGGSSP